MAATMLVGFADEWTTFFPSGGLEAIRHDLHLTYAQIGLVLVVLPAGGLLGNVFIIAADYLSRRWLAALGALAYGVSMIAFGLGHSLAVLLAAAFVWGAASDAFIHGCEVALVDLAGDDLPRMLARMNAWAAIGDLLGPLTLAGGAVIGFGWRGAFLGGGGAMLAYAAWLAAQRFPPPHPPEHLPHPLAGVLAVLRDRRVLFLAVLVGLFGLLDEPLQGFIIAYMQRVRGQPASWATALVMAWVLGGVAGYAAHNRLVRGRSQTRVLVFTCAAMVLSLPVMIFWPALPIQAVASLVFGASGAVFYTSLQAAILGLRPGQAGSTSAVAGSIGMLGMGFPALAGAIADRFGLTASLALYAVIPMLILTLLLAARRPPRDP